MFRLVYFPPSAQKRAIRNGIDPLVAMASGNTLSFCKAEPVFATAAECQARCDTRNAEWNGKYFHVREFWAVPVVERKPFIPTCYDDLDSDQRACYNEAVDEAERDFSGSELDEELDRIDREYFGRD